MARIEVNGIALNVEVWPSPPGPLSLTVGEGESPIEVSASVLPSYAQSRGSERNGLQFDMSGRPPSPAPGYDTSGQPPSPASGRGVGGEGRGGEGVPPLLLLHGFTGSAGSWRGRLPALARHTTVVAVDLIGHGCSDAPDDPARYDMDRCVADLLAMLDHLGLPRVAALGYSMGARVALRLAAAAPDRVAALVLESGSPGLATEEERRARCASDEALAERIAREGIEEFVHFWEAIPLFATQQGLSPDVRAALRRQRLCNSATGLANSLRGMGTGAQGSLWGRLGGITTSALIVTGALDEKFRAIGHAMSRAMPDARLVVVPDAGHAVHLERPGEFDQIVVQFLLFLRRRQRSCL
jgi:2-succinyl-6-hydroxy-2,4-cyclohexadiene-1-carboxylate synthase